MKHNLFSRFLSIALVLVMVASVMPASILADDELEMGGESAISEIVNSILPEETPVVEETPAPAEETPAPEEETPAPVEETPAPVEETPAPAEETPAAGEETPAAGEPAALNEEGQAAQETPVPQEPAEEEPAVSEETKDPAEGDKVAGVYGGKTAQELSDALMACKSVEEVDALVADLSEDEINAFMEEIGEEAAAKLEEHFEALLQAEDETPAEEAVPEELPEDDYVEHVPEIVEAPQPVVPFTNAVPMFNTISASAALLSNNMPMMRMARAAAPMADTYDAGSSEYEPVGVDGLETKKSVTDNGDGTYTVQLEAWTEGTVTSSETTKPLDIVLVLDQSGSMAFDFTSVVYKQYTNQTAQDALNRYRSNTYTKIGDSYSKVTINHRRVPVETKYEPVGNATNSTLYSNRSNLYYFDGSQYYKVSVDWSMGLFTINYTYTVSDINRRLTSSGRNTYPDFVGQLYYGTTTYEEQYEFTYTDANGEDRTVAIKDADTNAQEAFKQQTGLDLYYTESGGSEPRLNALVSAVDGFIDSVAEKAKGADGISGTEDDVQHRIAIVGFSSEGYHNTELLTGVQVTQGNRWYGTKPDTSDNYYYPKGYQYNGPQYGNITAQEYQSALRDVSTTDGLENVKQAVGYLTAHGGTQTDDGMAMANNIFAQNLINGEERDRVVIVFTDGIPGQSGYDSGVADDAIRAADTTKTTYGADVYAIGIFDGADATKQGSDGGGSSNEDKGNYFMQRLSSNNGTPQSPSYYLTASNSSELNAVFDSISQTTGSSKLDLGKNTVVKDVLTQYFTFPQGYTKDNVEIYTQAYDGTGFVGALVEEPNATVSINPDTGEVSVTNYDFSTHFISENGRDKDNPNASGDYHGEKLIIRFTIVPKEEFWGGNLVPTNNVEKSGVYESDENLVENFPEPVPVDVPLKKISLTAKDQNIYYSNTAPTAEELVNKITPPDDWRTDYVEDIVYTVNGNISNTEDGSYTVTATLNPKYNGTEPHSTSEPVTARVNVFKPVVTWKDTTQDTNTAVDKSFDGNKVSTVWKHGETEANSVLMHGTEPTLSFTFAQADSNAIPDTLTQELHVKVASVTANTQNLSSVTTFAWTANADSEGCSSTCVNPNPEYQFRIHLATGSLTITKELTSFNSTMGKDATFIFQVKHLETGKIWYRSMTFAKAGSDSLTMEGMPAGHYEVTELDSAGYKLTEGYQETVTTSVTAVEDGQAAFSNEKTGDKTPGDQDYVQNNFVYDKDHGKWVFTQG